MTAWRRVIELSISDADVAKLMSTARSRTEPASRVERARILLGYREDPSFFAVARALGLHHQTVQRCVERALAYGPMAALDDRPRPGKEPKITAEAKAWLVSLACRKAKAWVIPTGCGRRGCWPPTLLSMDQGRATPVDKLVQGTVCKILDEQEVKPHKVRYYLERRDPRAMSAASVCCSHLAMSAVDPNGHFDAGPRSNSITAG